MLEQMKFDALLVLHDINFSYHGYTASGLIYDDSRKRFENGKKIYTSSIEYVDFKKGILKTRNTTYKLIQGVL